MYKLRFFVGAPHATGRMQVAEADSMQDCAYKALEEARPKAALIAGAVDAAFAVTPGQGKLPLPPASIEIAVYKDDGQLALFDTPAKPVMPPRPKPEWQASGDFIGIIELKAGDNVVQIGAIEHAATTCSHALGKTVETAKQLIDRLKKDPAMQPAKRKGWLNFSNVTVTVEAINTQTSLLPLREEPRDWSSLTFPSPRL